MLHLERPEEAVSLLHLQVSLSGAALGNAALGGSREAGLSRAPAARAPPGVSCSRPCPPTKIEHLVKDGSGITEIRTSFLPCISGVSKAA